MDVINEVLILFLIMSAGFYARRSGMIDAAVNRGLAELLLNITMPLMILGAFNFTIDPAAVKMAGQVFLFSGILHAVSFWVGGVIYQRYTGETRNVLRFTAVFSNCAFMGYPVLQSIYGKTGVFYASIFTVPFIIALWTTGVLIFNGKDDGGRSFRKVLFNPGILAVAAGIFMFLFDLKLPETISKACSLLGSTTTPLAMILIGSMLGEIRLRELMGGKAVYLSAFIRLAVIPLVALGVLLLCGVRGVVLGVCVLSAAMPAAANTAAFAGKFGSDALFASRCVFVSTLLSIITIPVFIIIVKMFPGNGL
jgi:hypothetical protein